MPISAYLRGLRTRIGHDLVLLPSAAGVVRDAAGRLLLMRSIDDGLWTFPGGAVDPGEQPAQAVVREVWEESGVLARPVRLAAVLAGPDHRMRYPNGDVCEYVANFFVCEVAGDPVPTARDGEALDVRFCDDAEVAALAGDRLRRILALIAGATGSAAFAWDEAWLDVRSAHE